MVLSCLNSKLRNLLWLCGGYVLVACECIFSPSYLQFFLLIPSPNMLPTYIILAFIWTAWSLSLYLTHAVSRKHIPKYPKLVLPLHLLFFFPKPCCSSPRKLSLIATEEKCREKKKAIEMKTSSISSSSSSSSLVSPSTSHILFNSKNAERLGQQM